jgi:hypothetical protein
MITARNAALGICCALALSFILSAREMASAQSEPAASQRDQSQGSTMNLVLGEVSSIDKAANQIVLKTDSAEAVTVLLTDATVYLRVPPGEQTLDKAVKVTLADIGVGDRLYARGKVSDDKKSVAARQLVVMSKADIQQKAAREREQWQRRSIAGVITALDPQTKEIKLQVAGQDKNKPVTISSLEGARLRRYAPDSIKFSDAKPSSFADLKVGDQLRVLGERSADGVRFIPEEIVSGSFRTLGGTVTGVDAVTSEIKINVLGSRQPLIIVLNKNSVLRRITPQTAQMFIRQERSGPNPQPTQNKSGQPAGSADMQEVFDRLPALTLEQIKPGDVVMISSSVGKDPSRMTAIAFFAGLDTVLNLVQKNSQQTARNTPDPTTGLPVNVLSFVIGLP